MDIETWTHFVVVWTLGMVGLGANSIFCLTSGATNGFRRGVWAAAGIATASVVHTLVAVFGFSAILLLYADAYTAMTWLAVGYLLVLGLRRLLGRRGGTPIKQGVREGRFTLFRRGLIVSLSNPQAALNYLVFFIPFLEPAQPLPPQLAVIMPTAVALVLLGHTTYVLAGTPIRALLTSPRRRLAAERVSGACYIGTALLVAVSQKHPLR